MFLQKVESPIANNNPSSCSSNFLDKIGTCIFPFWGDMPTVLGQVSDQLHRGSGLIIQQHFLYLIQRNIAEKTNGFNRAIGPYAKIRYDMWVLQLRDNGYWNQTKIHFFVQQL